MPIHSNSDKRSLTDDHSLALELFCDRLDARALFARHLNALQTPERILWFHGDGGHGKSLLLRKLARDYSRLLPDADRWPEVMQVARWQGMDADAKRQALQAFDAELAGPHVHPVALAMLDFGGPGRMLQDLRQTVPALTELRRQLTSQGFSFPLFDYGMLLWLRQEGRFDKGSLQQFFGSTTLDVASQVLEVVADVPLISAVPKVFKLVAGAALGHRVDGDITQVLARWKLTSDETEHLARLDPAGELPMHLPRLLARDLNAAMAAVQRPRHRLVLMFDTHEAIWGMEANADGQATRHARDEWLRLLVGGLDLDGGIVVVVASRDAPRWTEAPQDSVILAQYLHSHLLGGLDSPDADDYLQQVGVDEADMRRALLEVAEVPALTSIAFPDGTKQRQHHPFYLGLAAETCMAMQESGLCFDAAEFAGQQFDDAPDRSGKGRLLLDRFLKYTDGRTEDAVQVLAAARRFDWPLYRHLADALGLAPEHASFVRLTHLSFVHPTAKVLAGAANLDVADEAGAEIDPQYRIHDLARRILRTRKAPRLLQADLVLHAYYSTRAANGDEMATVEAVYHQAALDAEAAERAWFEAFDIAMARSRHLLCQALAGLVGELPFSSGVWLAQAHLYVGHFWQSLSQHKMANEALLSALQVAVQALAIPNTNLVEAHASVGACHLALANGCAERAQHGPAKQAYAKAIANCRRALELAPEHMAAWIILGEAQQRQADLLASLSQHAQAQQAYAEAIANCRRAPELAPEHMAGWTFLGKAQLGQADLLASLSQHAQAQQAYAEAIANCRRALELAPEHMTAWTILGNAQLGQAVLLASLSQHAQAQQAYAEAIASHRRALELAPESADSWNNLGNALQRQADLLASLSQHTQAQQAYAEVIASSRRALELAPERMAAWINLGNAQKRLADLLASLSRHAQAQHAYAEAVASYCRALELAPEHVLAWTNLGGAQNNQANLLASLSQHAQAQHAYAEAIASHRRALELAPEHVFAWSMLGNAQKCQADLLASLSQHAQAQNAYAEAVASYRRALELAPESAICWTNLGGAQKCQADLLASLSQHAQAQQAYAEAIASYSRALELAPDAVFALRNLSDAQRALASKCTSDEQLQKAQSMLTSAAQLAARARAFAPADVVVIAIQIAIALDRVHRVTGLGRVTKRQAILAEARNHLDDWHTLAPHDPNLAKWEEHWDSQFGR